MGGLACSKNGEKLFTCVPSPNAGSLIDYGGDMENMPSGQTKLGACQGDCDEDVDCQPGLCCYQRDTSGNNVPGCRAGGSGDINDHDYCAPVDTRYQMTVCPPDCASPPASVVTPHEKS